MMLPKVEKPSHFHEHNQDKPSPMCPEAHFPGYFKFYRVKNTNRHPCHDHCILLYFGPKQSLLSLMPLPVILSQQLRRNIQKIGQKIGIIFVISLIM